MYGVQIILIINSLGSLMCLLRNNDICAISGSWLRLSASCLLLCSPNGRKVVNPSNGTDVASLCHFYAVISRLRLELPHGHYCIACMPNRSSFTGHLGSSDHAHLQTHAGRLRANSSRSCTVATPRTNRRLRSVTTAKSCGPCPSLPFMKKSSSSSSGVSIVITLYVFALLLNLTMAAETASVS